MKQTFSILLFCCVAVIVSTKYIGCYADNRDDKNRLIPSLLEESSTMMTVARCASLAYAKGYSYFGVQYSKQCYAGDSLDRATSLGQSASCDMNCSGDSSVICGGFFANSVYAVGECGLDKSCIAWMEHE